MVLASASGATIGLLITFGGIGVIVNGLIVYIAATALGERAQNRRRSGADESA